MRPGQQAPESRGGVGVIKQVDFASMRPGQQAPESWAVALGGGKNPDASMRPGQQAPESFNMPEPMEHVIFRFNEARAASPGIPYEMPFWLKSPNALQ